MLAAKFWLYKWHEFARLDGDDQSRLVAAYRDLNMLNSIQEHDARS
jgi:hypothetical protein